jgi:hypothetical protein
MSLKQKQNTIIMKKKVLSSVLGLSAFALILLVNPRTTEGQVAAFCSGEGPECARISVPNGVHIYYGQPPASGGGRGAKQ